MRGGGRLGQGLRVCVGLRASPAADPASDAADDGGDGVSGQPFDRELYDAVMAEAQGEPWSKEKMDVYRVAAWRAARISAERGTVSDDALLNVWHEAYAKRLLADKDHAALRSAPRTEARRDAIRAVRAAINATKATDSP